MSCFQNEVVVRRRVRGREPVLNVRLQLVAYKIPSVSAMKGGGKETNVSSCLFRSTHGEERLRPQVSTSNNRFARDTYPNHFGYHPLMPHDLMGRVSEEYKQPIEQGLRTFHDFLHITHKTMDHTQRLCNRYPSLVLCQSIQSLEHHLYLAFPQKFLCELLCDTFSDRKYTLISNLLSRP
jgi:hypothetical protein